MDFYRVFWGSFCPCQQCQRRDFKVVLFEIVFLIVRCCQVISTCVESKGDNQKQHMPCGYNVLWGLQRSSTGCCFTKQKLPVVALIVANTVNILKAIILRLYMYKRCLCVWPVCLCLEYYSICLLACENVLCRFKEMLFLLLPKYYSQHVFRCVKNECLTWLTHVRSLDKQ